MDLIRIVNNQKLLFTIGGMIEFAQLEDHPEMAKLRELLVRRSQLESPYINEYSSIHDTHAAITVERIAKGPTPDRRLIPNPTTEQYKSSQDIYKRNVNVLSEAIKLSKTN
jgi:hypothetical protein